MNKWDARFLELAKGVAGWSKDQLKLLYHNEVMPGWAPAMTSHHNLNLIQRFKS